MKHRPVFNLEKFSKLIASIYQHLPSHKLTKEQINNVLLELFSLQKASNKKLVKKFQELLSKLNFECKTSIIYEVFAKVLKEKNWNIAKAKGYNFYGEFFTDNKPLLNFDPVLKKAFPGGFHLGEVVSILGTANCGKTRFSIQLANDLVKANPNLKIKYIALEGILKHDLESFKKNFPNNDFTNFSQYRNVTIDQIEKDLDQESINNPSKDFNIIIIDYPQLLSYESVNHASYKKSLELIYQKLNWLAIKYNCLIIAPVQAYKALIKKGFIEPHDYLIQDLDPTIISIIMQDDSPITLKVIYKNGEFMNNIKIGELNLSDMSIK